MWTYEGIMRDLVNEGFDCHNNNSLRKFSFIVSPAAGKMPYECFTCFYHQNDTVVVQLFHNFPGIIIFAMFEKNRDLYNRIINICSMYNEKTNGIVYVKTGFTDDNERFFIQATANQADVNQPYRDQIYNYDFFKEILFIMMTIHEGISYKK